MKPQNTRVWRKTARESQRRTERSGRPAHTAARASGPEALSGPQSAAELVQWACGPVRLGIAPGTGKTAALRMPGRMLTDQGR